MCVLVGDTYSKKEAYFCPQRTQNDQRYNRRVCLLSIDGDTHYTVRIILHRRNDAVTADQMQSLIDAHGRVADGVLQITTYYPEREDKPSDTSSGGTPNAQGTR